MYLGHLSITMEVLICKYIFYIHLKSKMDAYLLRSAEGAALVSKEQIVSSEREHKAVIREILV